MHDTLFLSLKIIINVTLPTILIISTPENSWRIYTFTVILSVFNFVPIYFIVKTERVYKQRYVRKKYRMSKLTHILFFILEVGLIIFLYKFHFEIKPVELKICVCCFHGVFTLIFNYVIIKEKSRTEKKRSEIEKSLTEIGCVKGNLIVNGKTALEDGEKVQVLEEFNGSVLIRKVNGDEYMVSRSMIEKYKR